MKQIDNISKIELKVIKQLFITPEANKFSYLERFFTIQEIKQESTRFLYLMLLNILDIDEKDLNYSRFHNGLKHYKKTLN